MERLSLYIFGPGRLLAVLKTAIYVHHAVLLFLLVLVDLLLLLLLPLPFLPRLLFATLLPGLLPEATSAFLAACLTLVAGKYGMSLDGASFCTPKYPATRTLTLPFTTRGFPLDLFAPPVDRLFRGIKVDAPDVLGNGSLTS
jgi:hypothetical protein